MFVKIKKMRSCRCITLLTLCITKVSMVNLNINHGSLASEDGQVKPIKGLLFVNFYIEDGYISEQLNLIKTKFSALKNSITEVSHLCNDFAKPRKKGVCSI